MNEREKTLENIRLHVQGQNDLDQIRLSVKEVSAILYEIQDLKADVERLKRETADLRMYSK